ncbi:MAG: FtsW/RodA/SpoVE family cell cycle protein [Planctomycetota bacterium]
MTTLDTQDIAALTDDRAPREPISSAPAIVLCVLALLTIGVVMVTSAGLEIESVSLDAELGDAVAGSPGLLEVLTSKSVILMGLAVAALAVAALTPVNRARRILAPLAGKASARPLVTLSLGILPLVGLLVLVLIPGVGLEKKGASRWLPLPGMGAQGFQPSELAKWGLVLVLAWYATTIGPRIKTALDGLLPGAIVVGLVAGLIAKEDLGTGVLVAAVAGVVLVAAGVRLLYVVPAGILALAGAVGLVVTSDYRTDRVIAYLDPYADPVGTGYHMIQSMATIAGAGPAGTGLGHGIQKFGYLPEDTNDFLFAVITEELGFFGALLVITPLLVLVWVLRGVVARTQDKFTRLVVLGIASTIALQTMINLVVVTGLGPTKGIALPLVSAGGTGWILTAASLGLVIALERADAARQTPDLA